MVLILFFLIFLHAYGAVQQRDDAEFQKSAVFLTDSTINKDRFRQDSWDTTQEQIAQKRSEMRMYFDGHSSYEYDYYTLTGLEYLFIDFKGPCNLWKSSTSTTLMTVFNPKLESFMLNTETIAHLLTSAKEEVEKLIEEGLKINRKFNRHIGTKPYVHLLKVCKHLCDNQQKMCYDEYEHFYLLREQQKGR
ncbi:MAG: hypothetical protein OXC30_00615 [Alphaproteobacteria bacterium]|nr:hypothetical protein [Alphaproteobacteria bacterium]